MIASSITLGMTFASATFGRRAPNQSPAQPSTPAGPLPIKYAGTASARCQCSPKFPAGVGSQESKQTSSAHGEQRGELSDRRATQAYAGPWSAIMSSTGAG